MGILIVKIIPQYKKGKRIQIRRIWIIRQIIVYYGFGTHSGRFFLIIHRGGKPYVLKFTLFICLSMLPLYFSVLNKSLPFDVQEMCLGTGWAWN